MARVVVKGGGQRRTGAELRQMIGRAGRAGFGTKRAPDAWIVCAGGNGERGAGRAEALLGAAAPPIRSRLRDDDDGLRRHVLEAVSGGLLARREVMAAFDGALDVAPSIGFEFGASSAETRRAAFKARQTWPWRAAEDASRD